VQDLHTRWRNGTRETIFCLTTAFLIFNYLSFSYSRTASGKIKRMNNRAVWGADNNDATYTHPIIFADYSDPDGIRVRDYFSMVLSSFICVPGIPVLHSKDKID
jgi:hypothetical protein